MGLPACLGTSDLVTPDDVLEVDAPETVAQDPGIDSAVDIGLEASVDICLEASVDIGNSDHVADLQDIPYAEPCPPDYMAADGTTCIDEGRQCSSGCDDRCRFCNYLRCENGKWSWMEVFPDPTCGDATADDSSGDNSSSDNSTSDNSTIDDSTGDVPKKSMGQPCSMTPNECEDGLECLGGISSGGLEGACSRVCNPMAMDPLGCGPGSVCAPFQWSQAPGFCMLGCSTTSECPDPLTCGAWRGASPDAAIYGCWPWGPCDPLLDAGCGPEAPQCHVVSGRPACGIAGALLKGDKCDLANDDCGPGLVCGAINSCWPACQEDAQCQPSYDFCLKKDAAAPWGHCMVYL
jgi:hypothetical protein